MAKFKGLTLTVHDFYAYRAHQRNNQDAYKNNEPVRIVVIFHNKLMKRDFKKRTNSDVTLQALAPTRDTTRYDNITKIVYVSENLTKEQQHTYYEARTLLRNDRIHATWTSDGQIYIRVTANEKPIRINSPADLKTIMNAQKQQEVNEQNQQNDSQNNPLSNPNT
jgi:phage-related protein